ncbi:patched domain-containing protein 3-like [Eublepharis macularius]|uniref:Patched domain-containing protein 3 n=1 Tax=Eublepharis macularius TaxID=481883 RepID=A0AA97L9A3_EUBMA|nr:patched domain-containing protein 3-like [Eublepharis macularius]
MRGPCETDCVERPLSRALRGLGGLVGAHPWPFLLVPMALSAALGSGFHLLPSRKSNDIEAQFTPRGGQAKIERSMVRERFSTRDAERFSAQRQTTEGTFASFVAVAAEPSHTLLTRAAFAELLALDAAVRGLSGGGRAYTEVCARRNGSCSSPNPLLSAVGGDPARIEALLPGLTFPLWQGRVILGFYLGGVSVGPGAADDRSRPVRAAKALHLFYHLQEGDPAQREASVRWLEAFLKRIRDVLGKLKLASVRVAYFSSISRQEELEKNAELVVPLFIITYFLTISFSILSCSRLDCVRTKVWVAAFGVLSSGLSVISSFGLLLFCGVPFVITAASGPFLTLGVGVDDMFIMVSCWQQTKVKHRVEDRMANTYAEAAVSITITTLTDVLAFYIGIATSFPSIQSFCIYTGTSFVFCYIYNLTFFGAVLALNGRREESNRHWLTFMKVTDETQHSFVYNVCCVGGLYDKATGTEHEHPMSGFFKNHFGPFLMHNWTKVAVVLLYLTYFCSSIYGCTLIKEGIDLRNLVDDHSYVVQYYDFEEQYFKEYGPRVMVIVTKSISYWDSSMRADLEHCMKVLENSTYVDKKLSESWLRMYEVAARRMSLNIDDQSSFIGHLSILFRENPQSRWDVNFTNLEISASRFFIQTVNVTTSVDERILLNELRAHASYCDLPLIVYHPAFIFYDHLIVIAQNTIQNILIATGAMLFISLLLIPNPLCSLWVTFAIGSVIIGVTGFMAYWDVNLDSISMINLIMCIGFSVDCSAHISYAFVSSKKPSLNDKAVDALHRLGYPIVQGAVSTIVGVLVLSSTDTYIFRAFFKIIFLVISFGACHGLFFIPVFLTFFGFLGRLSTAQNKIDCKFDENSASIEDNVMQLPIINT